MHFDTKLKLLLREYWDRRFAHDIEGERFTFDTVEDRFNFIKRLSEIEGVEYFLYHSKDLYKIEVFYKRKSNE